LQEELAPLEDQLTEWKRLRGEADDAEATIKSLQIELDRLESIGDPTDADAIAELQGSIGELQANVDDLHAPGAGQIAATEQGLQPRRMHLAELLAAITPLLAAPHTLQQLAEQGVEDAITAVDDLRQIAR